MSNLTSKLKNMTHDELVELESEILKIRSSKTRTYTVSFEITFKADRTDDLADPDSFGEHVFNAFEYFGFELPECISAVSVTEKSK